MAVARISIVTASLNQAAYLLEALESVRCQRSLDVEHLVFDGGSTDGSVDLLRSLDWPHLRWQSGPDKGQSDALNKGFLAASGDIVGWLNSDDRYRASCFAHVLEAFRQHPEVDVFYGDYTVIDQHGKFLKIRQETGFSPFILTYHHVLVIPTPSTFFRRRIFDEGNFLRTDLHYAMDYEFFLRLSAKRYKMQRLPALLADFRVHPQSKSETSAHRQAAEKEQAMLEHSFLGRQPFPTPVLKLLLLVVQSVAGCMRWSWKFVGGAYFRSFVYRLGARR